MLIPKLPRQANINPVRFLYGIWQNLLGNASNKVPDLPTDDPNIAPTPLLHAIWQATKNGGGLPTQTGHAGEFLTTDGTNPSWASLAGGGDMLAANNLSDLTNITTARVNLGGTGVGIAVFTAVDMAAARTAIGAGTSNFNGAFGSLSGIPTTLAGYGITDAQPLDADLTAIAALTTTVFGRSLLTQADAAATRATIGAGTSSFDGTWASLTGRPANVDSFGALANSTGVLHNDGTGVFTYYGLTSSASADTIAVRDAFGKLSSNLGVHLVSGAFTGQLVTGALAADRTWIFKDQSGTVAFLSDIPAAVSGANPTASIGLAAVNGVAATFMRSDAAPALDVSIAPTWTGLHTFSKLVTITQGTANAGILASTGYSLTGSNATNMVDLAGTWNTSGAPVGIKLNITNTASGAAARLFDFQVGSVTKINADVAGLLTLADAGGFTFVSGGTNYRIGWIGSRGVTIFESGSATIQVSNGWTCGSGSRYGFSSGAADGATVDTISMREAAQHWTHRNGTTAQILSVSNTWTSTTNFERFKIDWAATANTCRIGTSKGGGGGSTRALHLEVGDTAAIKIETGGTLDFSASTANADAAAISTHSVPIKVGGTTYNFLVRT